MPLYPRETGLGLSIEALLRLPLIVVAFLLTTASCWLIYDARTDWIGKQPGEDRALAATRRNPNNPLYWRLLAEYQEQAGKNSTETWDRAVELDPRNPRVLIPAAIAAETRGDTTTARALLLQADRYNSAWLPRWSLANFAYRQGDFSETLQWVRSALDRAYGDVSAAFYLCAMAGADPPTILTQVLAPNPESYAGFLHWMAGRPISRQNAASAIEAAKTYTQLEGSSRKHRDGTRPIIAIANRLLYDGLGTAAQSVWRDACSASVLQCGNPPDDGLIVNGRLSTPFHGTGLDWVVAKSLGTSINHNPASGTVKVAFNGQVESADLMSQTIARPAGASWRLSFEYLTRNIEEKQVGFHWRLGPVEMLFDKPLRSTERWTRGSAVLPSPEKDTISPLVLSYRRPPGGTRVEGELWIRDIRAERLP